MFAEALEAAGYALVAVGLLIRIASRLLGS